VAVVWVSLDMMLGLCARGASLPLGRRHEVDADVVDHFDDIFFEKLVKTWYGWKFFISGAQGGKLAAQIPSHNSTMTQKVGLNICRTSGVFSWGGGE
jgi:hypothetical protein